MFNTLYEAPLAGRIVIGLLLLLIGWFVLFVVKIAYSILWLILVVIGLGTVVLALVGLGIWIWHGKDMEDVMEEWETAVQIWWKK